MSRSCSLAVAGLMLVALGCDTYRPPDSRPTMDYGPPMSIGLSFDFYANVSQKTVKVGEQFSIFVIAFGLDEDPFTTGFSIPALNSPAFTIVRQFVYPDQVGYDQLSQAKTDFLLRHGDKLAAGQAVHLMKLDVKLNSAVPPTNFALANSTNWQSSNCPSRPIYSTYDVPTPICLDPTGMSCTLRVET